jgi:uncharacterized membrane protein YczE
MDFFGNDKLTFKRVFNYLWGLWFITLGIGFSIKSNLGATPVSSIPYTLNLIWGIEIGKATIIFHAVLVLIELILLGKDFKIKHFLQVFVGVLFGYFTTFSVGLMGFIPDPTSILSELLLTFLSIFSVALGLFFYVPTNIIPVSVDGVTQALAIAKVVYDVSLLVISVVLCFVFLGVIGGSIGIGTILSAVFVGTVLKYIHKLNSYLTGKTIDFKQM